jgi:uncharacterized protein YgbK (DUF1537 family)
MIPLNLTSSLSCILIADDLTGACDAAVQFKLRGARTIVYLDADAVRDSAAPVRAFNTETRDAETSEMERRIHRIADLTSTVKPKIIFKKIDSLLRGNPGREIRIVLEAFNCDFAVVTPAFPEMGRTVRNGHLEVFGDYEWKRLEIAPLLRGQGLEHCTHIERGMLTTALERGARYISLDISAHNDLELTTAEALDTGKNVLWAGSGGLASALAATLFSGSVERELHTPGKLPAVFCIGSDHPVTSAQVAALQQARPTREVHAISGNSAHIVEALERGQHVILRIPRDYGPEECLRLLLQNIGGIGGALVLSGGDTATAVCHAMEVKEIEIADQVVAGLPWGTLRGGLLDGFLVATKSGAFGREADLIKVADFFTCPRI